MSNDVNPGQAFLMICSALTAVLVVAYYIKQIWFSGDPAMTRKDVERELEPIETKSKELSVRVDRLTDVIADLRVEISRLATLLEGRFQGPFRGDHQ